MIFAILAISAASVGVMAIFYGEMVLLQRWQ
jgi:hypothetical protein